LAGRDLLHFQLHEPNFFGQNYNTTFESIPGQLFHELGMSYAIASPFSTTLILTACWVVLALAAYFRQNYVAAAASLALPICLPIQYLLLADAPRGILAGNFCAALCIATAIFVREPRTKMALLLCFGGLGLAWDNATILAVAPAIAGGFGGSLYELIKSPLKSVIAAALGLILPVAWWATDHWWYSTHAIDFTAFPVQSGVSLSTLGHNLRNLAPLVSYYEPQLFQHLGSLLLIGVLLIAFAVYSGVRNRNLAPIFAAIGLVLAILVTLSVKDSLNQSAGLYLSGDRFLLPLPLGTWSVFAFATDRRMADAHISSRAERSRLRNRTLAVEVIFIVALASFISGQILFGKTSGEVAAIDTTPAAVVETMNPTLLIDQCSDLASLYRDTHSQMLLTNSPDIAYGCEATNGINTVDQTYDRRGWVLSAVAKDVTTRILLQGWICDPEMLKAGQCVDEPGGNALLVTAPHPAAVSLDLAGLPVRGAPTESH
jgi:hypothetical protein